MENRTVHEIEHKNFWDVIEEYYKTFEEEQTYTVIPLCDCEK